MALFDSVMEPCFIVISIRFTEDLIFVAFPLAEELDDSSSVSSLAEIEKGPDFTQTMRRCRRLCLPLEIEVTLLKALDNFELVADHPVFFCVLLEIETEVRADHGAGELLS